MEKSMKPIRRDRSNTISKFHVSIIQRRRLLELMKEYRYVLQTTKNCVKQPVWEKVAKELNALTGPTKTADQWRRSWADWRTTIRKHYAQKNAFSNSTENVSDSEGSKECEELDKEVMQLFVDTDKKMQNNSVSEDTFDFDGRKSVADLETFVDLPESECKGENINWDDETSNEFIECSAADESPKMPDNYPKSTSSATSQSFPEVNRACIVSQIQILDVLSKNTEFIEKQNVENRDPPSFQRFSELEKVLSNNQTQIMESLNKITGLIENQNAILFQIMQAMSHKN